MIYFTPSLFEIQELCKTVDYWRLQFFYFHYNFYKSIYSRLLNAINSFFVYTFFYILILTIFLFISQLTQHFTIITKIFRALICAR